MYANKSYVINMFWSIYVLENVFLYASQYRFIAVFDLIMWDVGLEPVKKNFSRDVLLLISFSFDLQNHTAVYHHVYCAADGMSVRASAPFSKDEGDVSSQPAIPVPHSSRLHYNVLRGTET